VITILGVLTAISAGKITGIMTQQRVARAATAVQGDIETAFAIAGRNRRPVRMVWNASTMQFQVTDRAGTTAYRTTTLSSDAYGLVAGDVTVSASPIEVYPNGLAADTLRITISITRGGTTWSRRVHASLAGLVVVD
jgi:type II secretory pathway pseudopilin PulG